MTDRELLNMIDAADDEFIVEAAIKKPRKKRVYIRYIAAAACMILAAGLGFAAERINRGGMLVPMRDFTVYSSKAIDQTNFTDEYNISLKDASDLDFNVIGDQTANRAPAKVTNIVRSKSGSYEVDYYETCMGANIDFDRYVSPFATALYNSENNALMYYALNDRSVYVADGKLVQGEAVEAAQAFNAANYTAEETSQFNYSGARRVNTATFNGYVIDYYRDFCGYKTDDTLTVNVNMIGEVVELNAVNMGVCDLIEQSVSKETLGSAEKILQNAAGGGNIIEASSMRITVDSTGNCYLYAPTSDGNDIYVKLNE